MKNINDLKIAVIGLGYVVFFQNRLELDKLC